MRDLLRACFATLVVSVALAGCKSERATPDAARATAAAKRTAPQRPSVGPRVLAASAHLRIVDPARGVVVGRVQLQKAVREIVGAPDGRTAYVAASDGVRAVDVADAEVVAKLSSRPARGLELSADGQRLTVLEHDVSVGEDGTRTPGPFSLTTFDVRTGRTLGAEVVGDRILYARRAPEGGHWVVVPEDGALRIGAAGTPWSGGTQVDLRAGLPKDALFRVRKLVARHGDAVFVPVEGDPARVLEVDTRRGETRWLEVGRAAALRGLGVTPDGKTLLVNTGQALVFVDRASGVAAGEPVALDGAHLGCAVSSDGKQAYIAKVKDEDGGAVTVVDLGARKVVAKAHLDDITPWAIALVEGQGR